MRIMLVPQPESTRRPSVRGRMRPASLLRSPLCSALRSLLLPAVVLMLVAAHISLTAQTPDPQAPAPASTPKYVHRKRPNPAHPAVQPTPVITPVPITPPEPEQPKWPAFDPAAQASVVWDSRGLRIDAANSSLQQILKDVSTATGAKVDGLATDERIFGAYGPGQAREVLSQLLQGSGYNVIMICDQGQGTPRQILLSPRQAASNQGAARTAQNNSNDEDNDVEEQPATPDPPAPARPGFPPGTPPRSPQQIMQEMQQRQQDMQQRQPPQQQQPPPNNPQ
jgi:hypothetical protein